MGLGSWDRKLHLCLLEISGPGIGDNKIGLEKKNKPQPLWLSGVEERKGMFRSKEKGVFAVSHGMLRLKSAPWICQFTESFSKVWIVQQMLRPLLNVQGVEDILEGLQPFREGHFS